MGMNRLVRQWEEGMDDCKEEKIRSSPEIDDMMPVRQTRWSSPCSMHRGVKYPGCIPCSAGHEVEIESVVPTCTWTAIAVYARYNGWTAKTYISECGHELSDMDKPKYCCKCGKLIKKLGE